MATTNHERVGKALRAMGGLELSPLVSRGLSMGDEMHQRNVACSTLTLRALAPLIAGVVIGVSEAVTMAVTAPSWAPLVSFTLLIVLLLVRPGKT